MLLFITLFSIFNILILIVIRNIRRILYSHYRIQNLILFLILLNNIHCLDIFHFELFSSFPFSVLIANTTLFTCKHNDNESFLSSVSLSDLIILIRFHLFDAFSTFCLQRYFTQIIAISFNNKKKKMWKKNEMNTSINNILVMHII